MKIKFELFFLVVCITLISCESFEDKKTRILNERIRPCVFEDCRRILNLHLDYAIKEKVISEKDKENIILLSNHKSEDAEDALKAGSTFVQYLNCATIQCWLDEIKDLDFKNNPEYNNN